jgi:hypothetical protein
MSNGLIPSYIFGRADKDIIPFTTLRRSSNAAREQT